MKKTDYFIRDYSGSAIQSAFRSYCEEMGISVSNWEGLFEQMTCDATPAYVRKDEMGRTIGFIQFSRLSMTSWFFEDRYGFVQEFWVAPEYRGHGHGGGLLRKAEEWFAAQGITHMILTTDMAEAFYLHHGYRREGGIVAKNAAPVYVKHLEQEEEA